MLNKMRIVLFALLFLIIFGCSKNTDARYKIVVIDNNTYIQVDEAVAKAIGASELAEIPFDSVEDFINTVKNGKLADWQISVILSAFPKDENGIRICDPDHICCPAPVSDMKISVVSWSGEQYSYFLEGNDGVNATMVFCTPDDYASKLRSYDSFFDKETITLISQESNVENGTTIYRYTTSKGEFKQIRYTFERDGRKYTVDEMYRISIDDETLPCSEDVPIRTTLYIEDNGVYCFTQIFDMKEKADPDRLAEFFFAIYN